MIIVVSACHSLTTVDMNCEHNLDVLNGHVFIGPPTLNINITKNIENSSVAVQWDEVDDSLHTTYTIIWADRVPTATVVEDPETSYTITGLALDTVYIIVTATNECGDGPEFRTTITFSTDITSTTSTISPTVTVSTNPTSIISTVNSITTITTTVTNSNSTSTCTTANVVSPTVITDSTTIITTKSIYIIATNDLASTTTTAITALCTTIFLSCSTTAPTMGDTNCNTSEFSSINVI